MHEIKFKSISNLEEKNPHYYVAIIPIPGIIKQNNYTYRNLNTSRYRNASERLK